MSSFKKLCKHLTLLKKTVSQRLLIRNLCQNLLDQKLFLRFYF